MGNLRLLTLNYLAATVLENTVGVSKVEHFSLGKEYTK